MPLLEVQHLRIEFPTRRGVLVPVDDISFVVERGEILGVVGESGAGKSLTGMAIVGLLEPPGRIAGGRILFEGDRIDDLSTERYRRLRGARIGMIFQDPLTSLNPLYTVGRHLVETILTHEHINAGAARRRALDLLAEVGFPSPDTRFDQFPHQFSGGMRQRIVIALALCTNPKLVVADEPTTALDVSIQAQIIALLKRLCREHHTAVMLITHDMGVIAEAADRVVVMYAGRLAEVGELRSVLYKPRHPYTAGLMNSIPRVGEERGQLIQIEGNIPRLHEIPSGCAFHPRCPKKFGRCEVERPNLMPTGTTAAACWLYADGTITNDSGAASGLIETNRSQHQTSYHIEMSGISVNNGRLERDRSVGIYPLASRESSPEPLVRVNDVARYFDVSPPLLNRLLGGERRRILKAVDGVSFSVPRGKTFALVGESGCGKSTLARVIVGLHRPTRGSVEFDGVDIGALRTRRRMAAVRRRLQMVFQDPYASLNPRWRVRDIIAEPIRTYRLIEGRLELTKRVHELLTHVGLSPEDDSKYPHEFSGGQRQRICIARALASKPDFIVFDEPTSALDVSIQAQILNLMNDLQREMGLTYLLISHNLAVVYHIADLVGVMYLGQIVELNTVKSLFSAPRHPYTRMLLDIVSDLLMPGRDRIPVQGEVPSPLDPPSGCAFHPRCRFADARCQRERPRSTQYDGMSVACHAVEEGRLTTSSGMDKPETGPPSDH